MPRKLYVHVPAQRLAASLPFLTKFALQAEVACHEVALEQLDFELLADCAAELQECGLGTTLHAPFTGIDPGSGRRKTIRTSQTNAELTFLLASKLKAQKIIFHPEIPSSSDPRILSKWFTHSLSFWQNLIPAAVGIGATICLENIYDQQPQPLLQLLSALDSPWVGHVFDIGHWNIFAHTELTEWLELLGPFLKHMHLHDNRGLSDDHLPLGQGNAPLGTLFSWLQSVPNPPSLTLENRHLSDVQNSLAFYRANFTLGTEGPVINRL